MKIILILFILTLSFSAEARKHHHKRKPTGYSEALYKGGDYDLPGPSNGPRFHIKITTKPKTITLIYGDATKSYEKYLAQSNDDKIVDVKFEPFGDRYFVEFFIWTAPLGTGPEPACHYQRWVITEVSGFSLKVIANPTIDSACTDETPDSVPVNIGAIHLWQLKDNSIVFYPNGLQGDNETRKVVKPSLPKPFP